MVAIALYVGAVLFRISRQLNPHDPDRRRCIAVVGGIGLIGALPWIVLALTTSIVGNGTPRDLYTSKAFDWPLIGFHGLVACSSLAIGLWIMYRAGSEFLMRHKFVFMVQPVSKSSVDRLGALLLLYPIAYLAILFALTS